MPFSGEAERYRRACLKQMYFELSSMSVYGITFESRQTAQNRKDIEHIVALARAGTVRRQNVATYPRWIPDVVLGALNFSVFR